MEMRDRVAGYCVATKLTRMAVTRLTGLEWRAWLGRGDDMGGRVGTRVGRVCLV